MQNTNIALLALALAVATGCSKGDSRKGVTSVIPSAQAAPAAPPPALESSTPPAQAKPVQHVEIQIASLANTMSYDKKELNVSAGAEVHLTFKNNSTSSVLAHNWVLVNPGTEASVAAAGLKLGESAGYLDLRDKDILANTPLAKHGETTEVTFTAPDQPGKYPYICSFPGHYMMMKGVLTVTP
jgi:azurin